MTKQSNARILAFVGLAGSGKSSAVDYVSQQEIPKIYFGGIMYDAMREAGIRPGDWEPEQKFREDLRKQEGKDVIAKRAILQARGLIDAGQKRIVLDGLYSWSEYRTLKREFPGEMTVVAVVTPKHLRYKRMAERPERPMQPHEVDQRDWSEIENLEKGGPIAAADFFIHNDTGLDHLHEQIDKVLEQIEFNK